MSKGNTKNVESFPTTGPDSESEGEPRSARAEGEHSLLDTDEPVVVKVTEDNVEGGEAAESGAIESNPNDGEEIIAENGLPYVGVSADWVKLPTKD